MTEPTTACRTGRHKMCGGYRCTCECHPGTPEERAAQTDEAIEKWLAEFGEVIESSGRHEGHSLRQVGHCVYCTCGYRYQGKLPDTRKAPPVASPEGNDGRC